MRVNLIKLLSVVPVLVNAMGVTLPLSSHANNVAFDNLDQLPIANPTVSGDSGDLYAQQFILGDQTVIRRVKVAMLGFGNPIGEIRLELWDDDEGLPGEPIAQIGTLHDLIPFGPTEPPVTVDDILVFDTNIDGLTPNQPYYVVQSFEDADADFTSDSAGWFYSGTEAGTFGASKALVMSEFFEGQPSPEGWREVASYAMGTPFEGQYNYALMRVVTVPEPVGSTLAILGTTVFVFQVARRAHRP